jgi:hypothetical protein
MAWRNTSEPYYAGGEWWVQQFNDQTGQSRTWITAPPNMTSDQQAAVEASGGTKHSAMQQTQPANKSFLQPIGDSFWVGGVEYRQYLNTRTGAMVTEPVTSGATYGANASDAVYQNAPHLQEGNWWSAEPPTATTNPLTTYGPGNPAPTPPLTPGTQLPPIAPTGANPNQPIVDGGQQQQTTPVVEGRENPYPWLPEGWSMISGQDLQDHYQWIDPEGEYQRALDRSTEFADNAGVQMMNAVNQLGSGNTWINQLYDRARGLQGPQSDPTAAMENFFANSGRLQGLAQGATSAYERSLNELAQRQSQQAHQTIQGQFGQGGVGSTRSGAFAQALGEGMSDPFARAQSEVAGMQTQLTGDLFSRGMQTYGDQYTSGQNRALEDILSQRGLYGDQARSHAESQRSLANLFGQQQTAGEGLYSSLASQMGSMVAPVLIGPDGNAQQQQSFNPLAFLFGLAGTLLGIPELGNLLGGN